MGKDALGAAAAEVHGPDLVTVQFSLIGEHLPLEGVHIGVFFRIGAHRVEVREVVFRADAVRDVQVKHERFCHGDAPCRFFIKYTRIHAKGEAL